MNVIVTRNQEYIVEGAHTCLSIENGLNLAEDNSSDICWIIGGAKVYEQCRDVVDEIHLTMVETNQSGDVRVGLFSENDWEHEVVETVPADYKNEHDTTYMILRRIS